MQLVRRNVIDFGKMDAKSAMISRDAAAKQLFLSAFVLPPTIDISAFNSGDRYLIYGTKGSGKTALLRFLMEEEKKKDSATKFIVFSEEIARQEKEKISASIDVENIQLPDLEDLSDVRDMWKLFLIKAICDLFHDHKHLCNDHAKTDRLREIIYGAFDANDKGFLEKFSRKIKSGTLRFTARASEFAELEAMINFSNEESNSSMSYGRFAEAAVKTICGVDYPEDVRYCLFIDELNLSMLQQKQHKKDSILIRDLVLSIGNLNRVFADCGVPIYIYAAIRMEVAKVINVSRNEIDKYLIDHGQQMLWHKGFDVKRYPLFDIVEHRISAIEQKRTGKTSEKNHIWKNYFANDIYGVTPQQFLSEVTWCNPRDIVNLFNLASTSNLHRPLYDTEVFSAISHEYSERVWSERAEELNAAHSMTVVNAIRRLLAGGFQHFKVETLRNRADQLSEFDPQLKQAVQTVGIEKICRDLYHIGVLGQSLPEPGHRRKATTSTEETKRKFTQTWFYRDNREFDGTEWLIVHLALYPALKLANSWNAKMFGLDPRTDPGGA